MGPQDEVLVFTLQAKLGKSIHAELNTEMKTIIRVMIMEIKQYKCLYKMIPAG